MTHIGRRVARTILPAPPVDHLAHAGVAGVAATASHPEDKVANCAIVLVEGASIHSKHFSVV